VAIVAEMEEGDADRAVRLVDVADRLRAGMVLGDARAVGEAGLPGVAGARVDFGEPDQLSASRWP
jgi:ABC-type taurine transport system substrate-binding protein